MAINDIALQMEAIEVIRFARVTFFTEDAMIEYFCSGEYSLPCEAGISPLPGDVDWTLCDASLKKLSDRITGSAILISDKDSNGLTVPE
jgi:hypothetical protein